MLLLVLSFRWRYTDDFTLSMEDTMRAALKGVSLAAHRRMDRGCERMESAHAHGLPPRLAHFAAASFSSHRMVPQFAFGALDKEEGLTDDDACALITKYAASNRILKSIRQDLGGDIKRLDYQIPQNSEGVRSSNVA